MAKSDGKGTDKGAGKRPLTVLQELDRLRQPDTARGENVDTGVPDKKVWPPRTMDDLSPEDRARQMRFAEKLKALQGKIQLNIDLDELRGRSRVSASARESEGIQATRRAVPDGDMPNRNEAAVENHEPVDKPADEELTPEERKHRAFQRAIALKGKIHLDIDIDELRGRKH
jgi:hypothetical protein